MIWWWLLVGYVVIGLLWAEFCLKILNHMSEADKIGIHPDRFYLTNFLIWPIAVMTVIFTKG